MSSTLPPPAPIFPPITFPRHALHGIPKAQAAPPTTSKPLRSKTPGPQSALPPTDTDVQEVERTDADEELATFKEQLLAVTPGSMEAEDLMAKLERTSQSIAKQKGVTVFTIAAIFAKALWKKSLGACNTLVHILI